MRETSSDTSCRSEPFFSLACFAEAPCVAMQGEAVVGLVQAAESYRQEIKEALIRAQPASSPTYGRTAMKPTVEG